MVVHAFSFGKEKDVKLKNKVYKSTLSYGYGVQATFIQLLSAYNAITNDGVMITPRIVSHLEKDQKNYKYKEQEKKI